MHAIYTEEFVRARLAERQAEIDLATVAVRVPPAGAHRRFGRRKRRHGSGSST
jgi:hypothetical protein